MTMGLMGPPPFISPSMVPAPPHHPGTAWGDLRGASGWTPGAGGPSWAVEAKGLFPSARREQTKKHHSLMNTFLLGTTLWCCRPPSQNGERIREGRCGEGQRGRSKVWNSFCTRRD